MLVKLRRTINFSFLLLLNILSSTSEAQVLQDSLKARLASAGEAEKASVFNQLAEVYQENASDKAIQYAESALKIARQHSDRKNEAFALRNLCLSYLYNDIYHLALSNGLAALELYEELGDPRDIAYMLSTLGWLYYDIQNTELALQYHERVLKIYQELGDKNNIAFSYNSLGLVYSLKKEYGQALTFYQQSLDLAKETGDLIRESTAHSNLGMTYTALGSYDLALEHLQKALLLRKNDGAVLSKAEIWNQMGQVFTEKKAFDKAENAFATARTYIEQSTSNASKEKLMDNLEFSAELYAAKGDFKKAFEASRAYSVVRNSILSEEKTSKLAEMRLIYETEKRENEIAMLENQKKIDRLIRNSTIAGFCLLLVIGYLTYSKLKSKNRQVRLEKERLKDKLDYKNSELTTFGLHIAQRNEILSEFVSSLKSIQSDASGETEAKLRNLTQRIEQSKSTNEELEAFHLNVEREHKDFFYHLLQRFPDLTENEKRLSAQLRLNLSNKDIAAMNNISVKSVEMARYRLRKRFGLDHKDSLTEFLKTF